MDKRILTHLVLLTLIISCSKGKPHQTPHPDQGAVVVTADWSGKSSEADIPQKYVLRIADVKQEVNGEKNTFKQLLDPGQYSLAVYNTPEHIAIAGNVVSMENRRQVTLTLCLVICSPPCRKSLSWRTTRSVSRLL